MSSDEIGSLGLFTVGLQPLQCRPLLVERRKWKKVAWIRI